MTWIFLASEIKNMSDQPKDDGGKELRAVPSQKDQLRAVPSDQEHLHAVPKGDVGDDVRKLQGGAVPPKTPVIRERPPKKQENEKE